MIVFLLAAHALADFPLQSDTMAQCKCRGAGHAAAKTVPWYYWLTYHALIHGAAVGLVFKLYGATESLVLAVVLAETVVHWLIDFGKCSKLYTIHVDQGLHILCKFLWWLLWLAATEQIS
jgi:hypothetical protein